MSDLDVLMGKMGCVMECVMLISGEVKFDEGGFNFYYVVWLVYGELEVGIEVIVVDFGGGNVVIVEGVGFGEDEIDCEFVCEWVWWYEEFVE